MFNIILRKLPSCHGEISVMIRTYATKSLFSPHSMVGIHISKLHSKNHDLGINIFIRKLLKYLPTSRNFIPKLLIFTGTYTFTEFVEYSESILWF